MAVPFMFMDDLSAPEPEKIRSVLEQGLARMRSEYVDRAVIGVGLLSGATPAEWVDTDRTRFYDPATLHPQEHEMLDGRKSHYVIALVNENPQGAVRYPHAGVEIAQRRHARWMLPPMTWMDDPRDNLNYITQTGVVDLRESAEILQLRGIRADELEGRIADGIKEWHATTRTLLERSGMYQKLEQYEREGLERDRIFAQVRQATRPEQRL